MVKDPPQTNAELKKWLLRVCGYSFPLRPSCLDHDAPLSWIADAFFGREERIAVLGPRGGGKTLGSACLHWASGTLRERYRMAHFGGTMQQALQCQAYIKEIAGHPGLQATVKDIPLATVARWAKGSLLHIHTATEKQASGPHPNRKLADEFDLWDWAVWQKFLGMGVADVQTIYTSTRTHRYGMMHNLLQDADKRGLRVYKYCAWDVKAPCRECLRAECELWDYCQGKHQESQGHITRLALVDKALQMDEMTIRTELFCEEPGVSGLCWPTFDSVARPGSNVDAAAEYYPSWPVFWGCDDNYEQPRCIALCQEDPHTGFLRIFDEYYRAHRMASEAVDDILTDKKRYPYGFPEYAVPDPTAVELGGALNRANIPTFPPKGYRREEGVKVAQRWIQDARGARMLLIHPRCVNIIRSVAKHHKKELPAGPDGKPVFSDEPEKHGDDHGADVVSYLCWVRRNTQ